MYTSDFDEYVGQVEFTVIKAHVDLSVDISNWTYGEDPIAPTGDGNVDGGTEKFEYALKPAEGSNAEPVFTTTVPTQAGKYIVRYSVEETELYASGSATKEFEILRKEINPNVSLEQDSFTYDGSEITPTVTVKYTDNQEVTLVKDTDYTVEYENNINKGQGKYTIKSATTSNYTFEDVSGTFSITAKELENANLEVQSEIGYTGSTLTPKVNVKVNGKALVKDTEYTLTLSGQDGDVNDDITVTVQGIGNYTGTIEKTVKIIAKKDQGLKFASSMVTKTYGDAKFKNSLTRAQDSDGVITFSSTNTSVATVNSSTGEVTILKAGETYIEATAGETELWKNTKTSYKLVVNKANYDMSKVIFANMNVAYDGKAHSIIASGIPNGVKVSYTNNGKTAVGSYEVIATFTGDSVNYNLIPNRKAILTITTKTLFTTTISGIKDKVYTGKNIKQAISIKDGNVLLQEGIDYKVVYSSNKKVGTAIIKISGIGNYAGTITKKFKINPKGTPLNKLTAGKKQFTVTWKAQRTETTGYEVQYSTNSQFKSGNKKINIKNNKTTSNIVKKLIGKKKYYVKVRTYKIVNGKKYYSGWSKVKNITTKK